MNEATPLNYQRLIPAALQAMGQAQQCVDGLGLERRLGHLVRLRASQLNQCAYCVRLHLREAREDGEREERLDRLVVWRHSADYSAAERAALAWTEALTQLQSHTDYPRLRADLREHFDEPAIGVLTATVAMINLWNRLQIARH